MHFYVESDDGDLISGWIALDNPAAVASILVLIPGREPVRVQASIMRRDVKEAGFHSTGLVGFLIDQQLVPDLSTIDELTIAEEQSGLPIHNRYPLAGRIDRKVVLIDTALMPQNRLYKTINEKFSLSYNFIEKQPFQTMTAIIESMLSKSIVLIGRPFYQRYISFIAGKEFFTTALLRNPFEELAERLLFIALLAKSESAHLLPSFTTGVEALVPFVSKLDLQNDKALTLAFRKIDDETRLALQSPMVRVLGCNPDERPERRHVGIALDSLSRMDLVGTRDRFDAYRSVLAGLLQADIIGDVTIETSPSVVELASRLASINVVADILELDLALYSYAEEAIDKGLEGHQSSNAA